MSTISTKTCPECGQSFEVVTPARGRPRKYCSDRCRWRHHGSWCPDCGARVVPRRKGEVRRCTRCHDRRVDQASREYLIGAAHEWLDRYGSPSGANDWNLSPSILGRMHPERRRELEARHRDRRWPATNAAVTKFGGWNRFMVECGFEPMDQGHRRDPDTWRAHRYRDQASALVKDGDER